MPHRYPLLQYLSLTPGFIPALYWPRPVLQVGQEIYSLLHVVPRYCINHVLSTVAKSLWTYSQHELLKQRFGSFGALKIMFLWCYNWILIGNCMSNTSLIDICCISLCSFFMKPLVLQLEKHVRNCLWSTGCHDDLQWYSDFDSFLLKIFKMLKFLVLLSA